MRYQVSFKEEKKKNDSISELDLYLYDKELDNYHLIRITKGLMTNRYLDCKTYDYEINAFDVALTLIDYDVKFYDFLIDELVTSKINNLVKEKNPSIELRKSKYESLAKEELAYISEEERATKQLIRKYRKV